MKMPIIEGLKKYIEEENVRFHMPGHKGQNTLVTWGDLIPYIDVTEVDGTDNLHNPNSIILESQELAKETFGSKKTFYSVNGTTAGIYSAIMAVTKPGDKILIQRNSHKSVYNAAILGNLYPVYLYPEYNEVDKIVMGVTPKDIEKALLKDSSIKAVVITYPSYYGICSNIKEISSIVHRYNRILIVDEAHGSHLSFSEDLPMSSLEAGADIVIQSAHKTLPAFTQSSMVHVGSHRVDIEKLKITLSMHQSTSPSYILMASLDLARAFMQDRGREQLAHLLNKIDEISRELKNIAGVSVFDKENLKNNTNYSFDTTKLLMNLTGINITGRSLETILRRDYKIQLEMADYYYGVAMTSVLNGDNDINMLTNAIADIASKREYRRDRIVDTRVRNIKPVQKLTLNEAFNADTTDIDLRESRGRIAATFLIPYPPGIPVICPGEVIDDEVIQYISTLKENDMEVLGLLDYNKEKIKVIK